MSDEEKKNKPTGHLWVNGIVSARDNQPYIQLSNEEGIYAQLSIAMARTIAADIQQMAARTEMDAMFLRYTTHKLDLPMDLGGAMMLAFREFRMELDQEKVERSMEDPDAE